MEFRCRIFPVIVWPNDWQKKLWMSSYFMQLESVLDQIGNNSIVSMSISSLLSQDSWVPVLVSKGKFQVCIAVTARWQKWLYQMQIWIHCTWVGGFWYVSSNFSLADIGANLFFSLSGLSSVFQLHPWDSKNLCVQVCSMQPCAASIREQLFPLRAEEVALISGGVAVYLEIRVRSSDQATLQYWFM